MTRQDRLALVLYVGVAVAVGFVDFRVRPGNQQAYAVEHYIPGVLAGHWEAPGVYRVLAPYLTDAFTRLTGFDALTGFVLSRLLFIYAAFAALHAYLRQWYSPSASTGGTLGTAALLPLTFTNGWALPDSFPELFLFTVGCLLIARRHDSLFLVALVVASLNRETAVFLVMLWGCYRLPGSWRRLDAARLAGYALTWMAVYAGLRWWRGFQSYQYWMFWQNLATLKPIGPGFDPYRRMFGYFWLVLLAVPAWMAILGSRMPRTPVFIRRALPVAAALFVVCLLISSVIEARIFTPMLPLLLPATLRVFAETAADEQPSDKRFRTATASAPEGPERTPR